MLAKLAEAKADEASLLELEIKTGEFGALKKNIKAFFMSHELTSRLAPGFRQRSTEDFIKTLNQLDAFLDSASTLDKTLMTHMASFEAYSESPSQQSYRVSSQFDKDTVKTAVFKDLDGALYKKVFGSSGAVWVIFGEHRPSALMYETLRKSRAELAPLVGSNLSVLKETIAEFKRKLEIRKDLKARSAQAHDLLEKLKESTSQNLASIDGFYKVNNNKINGLNEKIAAYQEQIRKLRFKILSAGVSGKADIEDEILAAEGKIALLRIELEGIRDVIEFCDLKKDALIESGKKIDAFVSEFKGNQTLIQYFALGDEVRYKLESIAQWLRGGGGANDSTGSTKFLFCFDAGVQLGAKLGILNLYQRIGVKILLGAHLAITDDRRVLFSRRLYLVLSTDAKFSMGLPDEARKGIDLLQQQGIAIEPPEELINMSAKVGASLKDEELIDLYDNEHHWACRTAQEIARRIFFLQSYDASLDQSAIDERFKRLLAHNFSGIEDAESRNLLQKRIKELNRVLTLAKKPSTRLVMSAPMSIHASVSIEAAGHSAYEKKRSDKARYDISIATVSLDASGKEVQPDPGNTVKGTLHETLAQFTDGRSEGYLLHHVFSTDDSNPKNSAGYLELVQSDTNKGTFGKVNVKWSQKLTNQTTDPRQREVLSRHLNGIVSRGTTPPAALDSSIDVPADVISEMLTRADIIKTGKSQSAFIEQVKDLTEKAEKISSGVDSIAERVAHPVVASVAEGLKSPVAMASSFSESLDGTQSYGVYMRYVAQYRQAAGPDPEIHWVPQVFRGQVLQNVSISSGDQTIPIIPGISAYVAVQMLMLREYAQYEILGTETFSYLRILAQQFAKTSAMVGLRGGKPLTIEEYVDFHKAEVSEILSSVVRSSSGPHNELMFACSATPYGGKGGMAVLGYDPVKARELGRACYAEYAPTENNPFKGSLADRQHLRNTFIWAAKAALAEKRDADLLAAVGDPEAYAIRARRVRDINEKTEYLTNRYAFWSRIHLDLVVKFEKRFNDSVTNKLKATNLQLEQARLDAIRRVYNSIDELNKRIRKVLPDIASIPEKPTIQQIRILAPMILQAVSETISFELDKGVDNFEDKIRRPDLTKFTYTLHLWNFARTFKTPTEPRCDQTHLREAWVKEMRRLYDQMRAGMTPRDYPDELKPLVPLKWDYDRGIAMRGWFQITSEETVKLIKALDAYNEEMPVLRRSGTFDPEEFAPALQTYLEERYTAFKKFNAAIENWKRPKLAETSDRMPNVVMLLQVPLVIEAMNLTILMIKNELHMRLTELVSYEEALSKAKFLPPRRFAPPKPKPIPPNVLSALIAFLKASPSNFDFESMIHGPKQIRYADSDHEVYEVSREPVP